MKLFRIQTLVAWLVAAQSCLAAGLITLEAESGTLGSNFTNGTDGATQFISISTDTVNPGNPGNVNRVASYTVNFSESGTYNLYARVRVGSGTFNDDSLFYGNGFGAKSPVADADWIFINGLAAGGYTASGDLVTGVGSAGSQIWKWVNLSQFTNGVSETPITFTVPAGNLTQTFQIGARENGLDIDAFAFGPSSMSFTVGDLDTPAGGTNSSGFSTVNWTDVRQRIDGFGAGVQFLNPSSLDPVPNSVMNTLFLRTNSNQLGLSILRIGIDPTDWNNNQLLDAQKAVARGASILATPWTPPASMKDNTNRIGGSLLPSEYTNYANYLNNFAAYMASNNAPVKVVSIQNEPDITVTYDSCDWTAAELQTFCRDVGGRVTNAALMMPESFNFNFNMSNPTLNDAAAAANVDYIGGHLYGVSTIVNYANAHSKGKPVWMTEYLVNDQTIETAVDTAKQMHDCLTVANMSAYIWWKSYGDANGLVNASGVPQKRGFVFAQWSWFVRPNDFRVGVTSTGAAFVSAYKNTNSGQFAIVAINTSSNTGVNQTFTLTNFTASSVTPWVTSPSQSLAVQAPVTVSNATFTYLLPPLSVVTFVGQQYSNTPPVLSSIADGNLNAGMTLIVTNAATDTDQPPQALTFSLLNPAPTNATLNSTNGVLNWRPLVSQSDTTNQFVVKVIDNGSPALSVTNTFKVTVNPTPSPSFNSIAPVANGVTLSINGILGPDYTLLFSTNLTSWQVLVVTNPPLVPFSVMDTNASDSMRFYRLRLGP